MAQLQLQWCGTFTVFCYLGLQVVIFMQQECENCRTFLCFKWVMIPSYIPFIGHDISWPLFHLFWDHSVTTTIAFYHTALTKFRLSWFSTVPNIWYGNMVILINSNEIRWLKNWLQFYIYGTVIILTIS